MTGRRRFLVLFSILSAVATPILVMMLLSGGYGLAAGYAFTYGLLTALLYTRYVKSRKPRYPLASNVTNPEPYFPRTNIPRPIYKDVQDYPGLLEKKQKDKDKRAGKTRGART